MRQKQRFLSSSAPRGLKLLTPQAVGPCAVKFIGIFGTRLFNEPTLESVAMQLAIVIFSRPCRVPSRFIDFNDVPHLSCRCTWLTQGGGETLSAVPA